MTRPASTRRRPLPTLLLALLLPTAGSVLGAGTLRGVVRDPVGRPVAGAVVLVQGPSWEARGTTDGSGAFTVAWPEAAGSGEAQVIVRASGFQEERFALAARDQVNGVDVVLRLPSVAEEVTVTASRTEMPVSGTAAAITLITGADLQASPALVLDDTLRRVPGFSLFRRTSSLTANPTSQGVSLRGIGASGASRALVLDDGIPLNDPFGGWVYWDRVPSALLERVEVARGGVSDLYGSGAVGGVVNLVRRTPSRPFVRAEAWGGSMETRRASATAGAMAGGWMLAGGGQLQATGGYVAVPPGERGGVDTAASSRHATIDVSAVRPSASGNSLFVRASAFGESRANGTPLQDNNTRHAQLAGGGQWGVAGGGVTLRAYASRQVFNQSFSAIAADRASEQLVRRQRVPSNAAGASVQWARAAARHLLLLGGEGRRVRGMTAERLPGVAGDWQSRSQAGGTQASASLFAGDTVALASSLSLAVSLRADWWQNSDAQQLSASGAQAPGETRRFPDRAARALSPRVGAVYRASRQFTLLGSAYRSFRAPTLNELYRSFRLGNVLTLANERLDAERLAGAEAGVRYSPSPDVLVSGRGFMMALDGAVANVTVSAAPGLVVRQRQNLGRVSSRGLEVEGEARARAEIRVRGAYTFTTARVSRFPADPRLEGLRVPQQPRHAITAGATIRRDWLGLLGVDARWIGRQFEDDQNRLPLAGCASVGASVMRPLAGGVELLASGENLVGSRCEVGRSPVTLLGPPRTVRLGARVTWGQVLQ